MFQRERFLVSGEVATIELAVSGEQTAAGVEQALESRDVLAALHEQIHAAIGKAFGGDYRAGAITVTPSSSAIKVTVIATKANVGGSETLLNKTGDLAGRLVDDLEELLKPRLSDRTAFIAVCPTWQLSKKLIDATQPLSLDSPDVDLDARLGQLEQRRLRLLASRRVTRLVASGALLLTPIIIGIFWWADSVEAGLAGAAYVLIYGAMGFAGWITTNSTLAETDADIRQIRDQIDLREINLEQREPRAQKLFQAHSSELKRYYDLALRQARSVYFVGVISMILGALVIAATFALILDQSSSDLSKQIIVAALGAIGAVMTNFIAVIYLRMFSDTIAALTGFHGRLVSTHRLHFGNFLAAKIGDDQLRDAALAEMAEALADAEDGPETAAISPSGPTASPQPAEAGLVTRLKNKVSP